MAFRGERKDYYAVLECYLEHNMNLLHTSEALFVHRTTLFNYLKEIRALIQADLDDPEARLRLLASFRIMAQDEVAGVAASIAAET
jgi:DNA-binding PucR family transcriptional regulator